MPQLSPVRILATLMALIALAACDPGTAVEASYGHLAMLERPPNSVDGNPTSGNTAGCDGFPLETSCQPDGPGVCCDAHDSCIARHCAPPDSGDVRECLRRMFTNNPCSAACQACHDTVVACFTNNPPGQPRGPSACCGPPNVCGRLQQCIINGRVETDACVCEANGVRPHQPCVRDAGAEAAVDGGADTGSGDAAADGNAADAGTTLMTFGLSW